MKTLIIAAAVGALSFWAGSYNPADFPVSNAKRATYYTSLAAFDVGVSEWVEVTGGVDVDSMSRSSVRQLLTLYERSAKEFGVYAGEAEDQMKNGWGIGGEYEGVEPHMEASGQASIDAIEDVIEIANDKAAECRKVLGEKK